MSINVKKYTKDQMAKMVEDAQEKTAALEAEIIELKNCIDDMHQQWSNAEQRANYAEAHPWRNLWAWGKREAARHE